VRRLQVVYGDTDSMFVHLPGRSREEAFRIGAEIAAAVTAANPRPVKLQMEKVRTDAHRLPSLQVAHVRACDTCHRCISHAF
jgi:hypothetical protein